MLCHVVERHRVVLIVRFWFVQLFKRDTAIRFSIGVASFDTSIKMYELQYPTLLVLRMAHFMVRDLAFLEPVSRANHDWMVSLRSVLAPGQGLFSVPGESNKMYHLEAVHM